jgi:hypothetical protein
MHDTRIYGTKEGMQTTEHGTKSTFGIVYVKEIWSNACDHNDGIS